MNNILKKIEALVRDPSVQIDATGFIFALIVSALLGVMISLIYQMFYENRATGSQIHRSFLLISPSITALFIAIQFSLPLSLGLLGALSIIRFRTPIKEPEEVGFIMFLVAGAVVCATFQFVLLSILILLIIFLLAFQKYFPKIMQSKRKDGIILLTFNRNGLKEEIKQNLIDVLNEKLSSGKIESISISESITTVHYSFTGLAYKNIDGLYASLQKIIPIEKMNVFFNRQGALF